MVKKIKKKKRKGERGLHPAAQPLLAKLDRIEDELRSLGWWRVEAIDPFAHMAPGEPRSYRDASSFEDWLQFVFLPTARSMARSGELPDTSHVGDMAQDHYDATDEVLAAQPLVGLLVEFDELIEKTRARLGAGRR